MPKVGGLNAYRRLLSYVYPYRGWMLASVFGFLLYAATQPLFAAIIKHIIDMLQAQRHDEIQLLPLLFVALMLVRGIGSYLGNYFLAKASTSVVHDLRCELFNHYAELPVTYFDQHSSGHLLSRITHNVSEVTNAATDSIRALFREGLTTLGLALYLLYINWQLTLIFLLITPFIAWLVTYVSRRLRTLSKQIQSSVGDMTQITSELLQGNRIVKSYAGETYEKQRFKKSSQFHRRQSQKLAATTAIHGPLMQLMIGIALAGLVYLSLVMMQDATAGTFVAFITVAFLLPRPIRQLSDANAKIQKGVAAAESLFEILDVARETDQGDYAPDSVCGRLSFEAVSFTYPNAQSAALDQVSFSIEPGQTVALVGVSGGGKTTLMNLIPRFYDYQQGVIRLDGVELKDYRLAALRQQVALVTQHVTLFNDTIANNIAYGALQSVSRQAIERAAEQAYALPFIEHLPKGFATRIGENGVQLSGGQKQRLALARALLKDAPLLLLDEPTSALDSESEYYIQQALTALFGRRTLLIIAHRLSTIERADTILVLERGRIVESGTHQQLLAQGGVYTRFCQLQFPG
ncbi:MAG: lipid A export permease/ATP-binding protein MsbA [Methylococcales bacterium]|nr:lipid A export permease/ATP-binding protein MsbA [Methylococcales bacterium]